MSTSHFAYIGTLQHSRHDYCLQGIQSLAWLYTSMMLTLLLLIQVMTLLVKDNVTHVAWIYALVLLAAARSIGMISRSALAGRIVELLEYIARK